MNAGFSVSEIECKTSDGRNIVVTVPFTYTRRDGGTIVVPVGTMSDGASTPAALWPTLPPFGAYWLAAVLHDYLYRYSNFDKAYCDETLLEAMEVLGVSEIVAHTIYEGVHLGGWMAFNEDRKSRGI